MSKFLAIKPIRLAANKFQLSRKQALVIAMAFTAVVMGVEFLYSYLTGSLMLFSDGIHMLSHLAALGVSLGGMFIAAKPSSDRFPFGLKKAESLSAFINGLGLALFSFYIAYECVIRLFNPSPIDVSSTIAIAVVGLLCNLLTAVILNSAESEDLNMKSAIMHMLADTFSSVAIIVGAVVIAYSNWFWVDAILSLVIAAVIGKWAYGLLISSAKNLLDVTPNKISSAAVKTDLYNRFDSIISVDSAKIWKLNESENAAIISLRVYPGEVYEYRFLKKEVCKRLSRRFGISQVTVEFDW